MEQQIISVLTQAFTHAQVDLDRMPNGRFSGVLVWEGFSEDDAVERQQRVRRALAEGLNGGAENVGILLVYTPQELQAMRAA